MAEKRNVFIAGKEVFYGGSRNLKPLIAPSFKKITTARTVPRKAGNKDIIARTKEVFGRPYQFARVSGIAVYKKNCLSCRGM